MYPLIPVLTQMTGSPVFTSHVGCINSLCGHQVFTTGVAVADADPADPMSAAAMTPPRTAALASAFTVFSLRRLTRPLCEDGVNETLGFAYRRFARCSTTVGRDNCSKTIADRTHSPIDLLSLDHPIDEDEPGTSPGL
ncbi:hypothetical protein ACFXPS_17065 [Nocardia sp. NPDC059091]|uniref:hypothetical protein n=1 Tax=Nocardia sp. NPDC059091 TaxID=3346724 RepID=UPI0036A3DAD2